MEFWRVKFPLKICLAWGDFIMYKKGYYLGHIKQKVPLNKRKLRRFRSSCVSAKYQPGSQFIHLILSNDSVNGLWMPWSDCASDLDLLTGSVTHIQFDGQFTFPSFTCIWWNCRSRNSLRKNAYSNILKILPPKKENFQRKSSDILHISAQNIDHGYALKPPLRGGSNAYPQSMFLNRNKKNNVYPFKP